MKPRFNGNKAMPVKPSFRRVRDLITILDYAGKWLTVTVNEFRVAVAKGLY